MLKGVYIELGKCCNTRPTGLLFSANSAIIRFFSIFYCFYGHYLCKSFSSFFGANSQMPTTRTEHEDDDKREEDSGSGGDAAQTHSASINRQQKDVNTLKMISHRMIRVNFMLYLFLNKFLAKFMRQRNRNRNRVAVGSSYPYVLKFLPLRIKIVPKSHLMNAGTKENVTSTKGFRLIIL